MKRTQTNPFYCMNVNPVIPSKVNPVNPVKNGATWRPFGHVWRRFGARLAQKNNKKSRFKHNNKQIHRISVSIEIILPTTGKMVDFRFFTVIILGFPYWTEQVENRT